VDDPQEARTRDDKAEALMRTANSLIPQGKWPEAAEALEEAAWMHAEAGRSYDESRCLQLAATRTKAPVPPIRVVLSRIMRTRTGRVGMLVAWAWLGLHFFAK